MAAGAGGIAGAAIVNAFNKPNEETKTIIIHDNAGNPQAPASVAPSVVPNVAPNAAPGKFVSFFH